MLITSRMLNFPLRKSSEFCSSAVWNCCHCLMDSTLLRGRKGSTLRLILKARKDSVVHLFHECTQRFSRLFWDSWAVPRTEEVQERGQKSTIANVVLSVASKPESLWTLDNVVERINDCSFLCVVERCLVRDRILQEPCRLIQIWSCLGCMLGLDEVYLDEDWLDERRTAVGAMLGK